MAKKKQHIDDLFKDNLKGAPLPLDGSEWERMLSELHPKKKKRFAWWWFLVGALLVGAVGLLVNNLVSPKSGAEASISQSDSLTTNNIEIRNSPKTSDLPNVDSLAAQQEKSSVDRFTSTESDSDLAGKKPFTKPRVASRTNNSRQDIPKANKNSNDVPKQSIVTTNATNDELLVTIKPILYVDVRLTYNSTITTNRPSGTSVYLECIPLSQLIPQKDTTSPKFVDPYIGIIGGVTQFRQTINSPNSQYRSYRSQNESPTTLPNFGLEIGAEYKGLNVSAGLNYQSKGQENASLFRYEIYDSLPKVDIITNDTTWLPYNYRDTVVAGVGSPRYQFITLPISIGKTVFSNSIWDISVGANTQVQYLLNSSGFIVGDNLTRTNIGDLSAFKRLSLSYGLNVGLGYAIDNRTKVKLVTRYNTDAFNMFSSSDNSQKISGFGADISVQFKLRNK